MTIISVQRTPSSAGIGSDNFRSAKAHVRNFRRFNSAISPCSFVVMPKESVFDALTGDLVVLQRACNGAKYPNEEILGQIVLNASSGCLLVSSNSQRLSVEVLAFCNRMFRVDLFWRWICFVLQCRTQTFYLWSKSDIRDETPFSCHRQRPKRKETLLISMPVGEDDGFTLLFLMPSEATADQIRFFHFQVVCIWFECDWDWESFLLAVFRH